MTVRYNLSVPHAALLIILSGSTCSHRLCHTRMTVRYNLSIPHAPLLAILPESTCSPIPIIPIMGVWGPRPHVSPKPLPLFSTLAKTLPHGPSLRRPFFIPQKGVWGCAPMLAQSPCPYFLHSPKPCRTGLLCAAPFSSLRREYGACPMFKRSPCPWRPPHCRKRMGLPAHTLPIFIFPSGGMGA